MKITVEDLLDNPAPPIGLVTKEEAELLVKIVQSVHAEIGE